MLGNVDTADRYVVVGWAIEPDFGDVIVYVNIVVDGRLVAEVRCDVARSDLRAVLGRGDGRCGFVYRFDPPLPHDTDHVIVVKLARTGEVLPYGERVVPAVPPPRQRFSQAEEVVVEPHQEDKPTEGARVACLIIAYRGAPVLRRTAEIYRLAGWDVFVHLDRKADPSGYRAALGPTALLCSFVEDPIEVFWGGFSMIEAELKLIEAARRAGSYDRFILTSDDAIPTRPMSELNRLANIPADFIELTKQPEGSEYWHRYMDFYFLDHAATSPRREHFPLLCKLDDRFFDKLSAIERLRAIGKKHVQVYWGSQFWSLTAETVAFTVDRITADEHLTRSCEFSAIPDELLFQTIIGNAQEGRSIRVGPVYADWRVHPGPRIYSTFEELPYNLLPEQAFLRKIAPRATTLVDMLMGNLKEGRGLYQIGPEGAMMLTGVNGDGRPMIVFSLLAPPPVEVGTVMDGWHPIERSGPEVRFRWTRTATVEWTLDKAPPHGHQVRFVIPLVMAITPEFADACGVRFAGRTVPAVKREGALVADFDISASPETRVFLLTPEPVSPAQVSRASDKRQLGLAIRALDAR